MEGFNDSMEDAERLIHLLEGIPSKINLIPYNENPDREILRPSSSKSKDFNIIWYLEDGNVPYE